MKKVLYPFLLFAFFLGSCGDSNDIQEPIEEQLINAEFRDFSGLDGCMWVIELEDGAKLEPINLSDFDVLPLEGKKIAMTYVARLDMSSVCMVGTIVELQTLEAI